MPQSATADYEALRRRVLDGNQGDRELGLALLMRQGMAAWLRAWSNCGRSPSADLPPRASAIDLPSGVRGEVARMLVTMALGVTRQEARP